MSSQKSSSEIKSFITKLQIEMQDAHAKLIHDIELASGDLQEAEDLVRVLRQIYIEKEELLRRILREL